MKVIVRKDGLTVTAKEFSEDILYIGRSKKNEIVLADSSVSRRHAKLYRADRHIYLEDLESANGTRYAGEKISRVELNAGDSFDIGVFHVTLELPDEKTQFDQEIVKESPDSTFAEVTTDVAAGPDLK